MHYSLKTKPNPTTTDQTDPNLADPRVALQKLDLMCYFPTPFKLSIFVAKVTCTLCPTNITIAQKVKPRPMSLTLATGKPISDRLHSGQRVIEY
jgi:hypothetical protein